MDIQELQSERDNLKDTARFFININLGAIAALFAFFSFLSKEPGQAIELAVSFKTLIGFLSLLLAFGFYCEYLLSVSGHNNDYKALLESRLKDTQTWLKWYIRLWFVSIAFIAFVLINVDVIVTHDATI